MMPILPIYSSTFGQRGMGIDGMLMHAFSSKGRPKIFQGGGAKKIRNRAAVVTGPQRHLAALALGDSSLYNSPRHAAGKSFEINQLAYHYCSVDSG